MKIAFLAAASLLAFPVFAGDDYRTYRNARFGTTLVYPANLLAPRPESPNGDGRRFFSRDGKIELSVFAFRNLQKRSARGEMNRAGRDWKRDGARITYQKSGTNWFALSGYVGSDIFYEKTLFKSGVFHTLIWQYPPALKKRLDAPVTRSVRTFGVGQILEKPVASPAPNSASNSASPAPKDGY